MLVKPGVDHTKEIEFAENGVSVYTYFDFIEHWSHSLARDELSMMNLHDEE